MKLTVYLCSGDVCRVIREFGHPRATCLAHNVEYVELDRERISPAHRELAERAGINDFPLFVVEDGLDVKVFDASGWAWFERKLRDNGVVGK